ncbi:cupin domain-containing protein [Leifsonia sp. NPDC077715]|uniref:cupin domain-containing protein n=1 Tax=Leifsonia sp. NPDC077715 TaxID=3155539 RepID=UPI00341B35A9
MTSPLPRHVAAASLEIAHEAVPPTQVVDGRPTTGVAELGEFGGAEIGVWEAAPGTSTDVEADEVFVVVAGRARIEFAGTGEVVDIGPGDVVRLRAGEDTVWTIHETLRKVYLAPRTLD